MYKNNNGTLFITTSENDELISGIAIIIADNIRGRAHGHLILSNYESSKTQFAKVYFEASQRDYRNLIDLIFLVRISDER